MDPSVAKKVAVQNTINDIVKAFSETPFSVRTNFETLKLISEHWSNLDRSLFDSDQHFIVTSAKVTDHLLRLLMSVKNEKGNDLSDGHIFIYEHNK